MCSHDKVRSATQRQTPRPLPCSVRRRARWGSIPRASNSWRCGCESNAVIVWNTAYMAAALDRLRIDGHPVQEADLAHLSPCRYEHINPYGKYAFEMSEELGGAKLRPLRSGRTSA